MMTGVGLNYACTICIISQLLFSQATLPARIGLIPWNNVTDKSAAEVWPDLDTLSVKTVPNISANSSYSRIEETYMFLKSMDFVALIGPYLQDIGMAAESLRVPYLCVNPVTAETRDFTLELMPRMEDIGKAIYDIAHAYGWKKISVFYDDDKGITLLEKLMTDHTMIVRGWRLKKWTHDNDNDNEVKRALVEMRKVLVEHSIILCEKYNTKRIIEEALSLAMLSTPPYEWLFYDPENELKELLLDFKDIAVNFTVLSLLPFNGSSASSRLANIDHLLLSDAIQLVTSAYDSVTNHRHNFTASVFKDEMKNIMKQTTFTGFAGPLTFTSKGVRDNFTLIITSITGETYTKGGYWVSKGELNLCKDKFITNRTTPFPLKGRTVKVVMIEEKPFTMLRRDHISRKGNDRFMGFAVDLIEEVAGMLDFKYEIYLVNDGKFGSRLPNGEWNGMIGELLSGNATMSVAPLSINSEREEAVDFTKPFMTRYIGVLLRLPRRETSYFEFLNPLSPKVWMCTLCAFVVVSIVLYLLERVGTSRSRSASSSHRLTTRITMREAFWFIFGSLLQGNTDSSPSTIPGRILTSAWWFFALILISSYTANLAAFLTVKKINTPIKSVTDLALQTKIKYGTVKSSGIMSFFKNTNVEHFAKMWAQMSEIDPDSMLDNTSMGFRKVKDEDYAFFWDTTVIKYMALQDCEVMEIGPQFDPKGFGIGVPPGATYREDLSMAILKLSDTGKLHELETRYWGGHKCPDQDKVSSDETSELQIENVAGVFFILVGGIIIAGVVCLGEYVGHALLRASRQEKQKAVRNGPTSEAFL